MIFYRMYKAVHPLEVPCFYSGTVAAYFDTITRTRNGKARFILVCPD